MAAAARGSVIVLLPVVAAGFLRVATNRRIFWNPTPMPAALGFLRDLLAIPGVRLTTQGAELPRLARLCEDHDVSGGDVTDAWIAASVIDQHEHLVTFDRGFRRYLSTRDLTVLTP